MKVESIELIEIIDSRTKPTIQTLINSSSGKAPSGASTGTHEAKCFVPKHLEDLEEKIKTKIEGRNFTQEKFDKELQELDGTDDFSRLGAIGIASSLAFKNANGFKHTENFPYPLSNVIGGGEHGGNTSIQEFLVIPVNAKSFPEAVKTNTKIYQELKDRYKSKIRGINDEGALITSMDDEKTLKALKKVADKHDARIGLDMAASEFYKDGKYRYAKMNQTLSPNEQLDFVEKLIEEFDLLYVEDPFDQEDFEMHARLTKKQPDVLINGDDLFTTNSERLEKGIAKKSCNSLIIKPNQIGTVTQTKETVSLAQRNDYTPVISHRSGETCDSTISDLALEWNIPIIKAGIADIRIAKLNKLIKLWNQMENPKMNPEI